MRTDLVTRGAITVVALMIRRLRFRILNWERCDKIVTKTVLSYSALLGDIDLRRQGWGV
jgi:hypothetical protein